MTHRTIRLVLALASVVGGVSWPPGAAPGPPSPAGAAATFDAVQLPPPDSAALHREARDAQRRFERDRAWRAPLSHRTASGPCDERVGRFCIRFGGEDSEEERRAWILEPDPEEPEAVTEARGELIAELERIARAIPADRWVAGQLVAYLIEAGRGDEALRAARACRAAGWWCAGLEGMALHELGRVEEAERVLEGVIAALPDEERAAWDDPAPLVSRELHGALDDVEGEELSRTRARIWRLADPLFLVEGNALRSAHLARRVLAATRADARNAHGISWSDDLTELLVRFGPIVTYERMREPLGHMGPPPMIGRYDRASRHLLPSAAAVADPAASEPDDWRTDRRRARSRHRPPAVSRIHDLDAQVARFRRGDDLLVVAGWALPHPPDLPSNRSQEARDDPEAMPAPAFPPESPEAALFLALPDGPRPSRHPASFTSETSGVATGRASAGDYLVSLEVLDPDGERAWRSRQGVRLEPLHPDVAALSDLLLLEPDPDAPPNPVSRDGLGSGRDAARRSGRDADAPLQPAPPDPDDSLRALDELLPRALPTTAFEPGPVEVVWEVYGLSGREGNLDLRLEASREDRGTLRRLGERLGLLSAPSPVVLEWEEGVREGAGRGGGYLRRVLLDLSSLEPGRYRLTLSLSLPGRTAVSAERTVELLEGPEG